MTTKLASRLWANKIGIEFFFIACKSCYQETSFNISILWVWYYSFFSIKPHKKYSFFLLKKHISILWKTLYIVKELTTIGRWNTATHYTCWQEAKRNVLTWPISLLLTSYMKNIMVLLSVWVQLDVHFLERNYMEWPIP